MTPFSKTTQLSVFSPIRVNGDADFDDLAVKSDFACWVRTAATQTLVRSGTMRVSHVNSFLDGGAATAARRLHEGLRRRGHDSRFYYARQQGVREDLDASYQPARWRSAGLNRQVQSAIQFRLHRESFKRSIRQRPAGHEVFTSPRGAAHTAWPPLGHPAADHPTADRSAVNPATVDRSGAEEIVHLHWIAKFIDYQSFFASIGPHQPVVWTLHDMNAFTGGCHFSDGCHRFQQGCGNCPQIRDSSAADISRQAFLEKESALRGIDLHVVAPSRWLLQSARSSPVFQQAQSFHHVPYGISTDDYYPMDRAEARAWLGIDDDATVISFGAMDVKSRRKGASHLMRALSGIADVPNIECVVFGSGELPETKQGLPPIREVGAVQGLLQQRVVYSASDVFVLPSLEDNLPLTGLEAMACGTAVVAFDAGGIPDYVHPQRNGLLARVGDTDDLTDKLKMIVTQPDLARYMGQQARRSIQQNFAAEREAEAYSNLYASLIESVPTLRRSAA